MPHPESLNLIREDRAGVSGHHPKSPSVKHAASVGIANGKTGTTLAPVSLPVSCWRMDDICFAFDKAYIELNSQTAFDQLRELFENAKAGEIMRRYKRLPLLALFGHADRVGKARYNKKLSEARAKCVYGALVRNPQTWLDVFKSFGQTKYLRYRLKKDGYLTSRGNIKEAIRFYMRILCGPLEFNENHFVGGKAYQGCAAFNPVFVLPESEWKQLQGPKNKDRRDELNQRNRRVVGFLFKPDVPAADKHWFCKKYPDLRACAKHLVKDAGKRLVNKLAEPRDLGKSGEAGETFACGFYEKLAKSSPCERAKIIPREVWKIYLWGYYDTGGGLPRYRTSITAKFKFRIRLNVHLEKPNNDWVVIKTDVVDVKTDVEAIVDPQVLKVLHVDYVNKAKVLALKGSPMEATVEWVNGYNPNSGGGQTEISDHVRHFWDLPKMRGLSIHWPGLLTPQVVIESKMVADYKKDYMVKGTDGVSKPEHLTLDKSQNDLETRGFFDRARGHVLPLVKTELSFRYKHEGTYWILYDYSLEK